MSFSHRFEYHQHAKIFNAQNVCQGVGMVALRYVTFPFGISHINTFRILYFAYITYEEMNFESATERCMPRESFH